jgi:UDP-N-acetylglucosamine acyltransferase
MATVIHPTAIVEAGAELGVDCDIRAGAIITRHCVLGDRVVVHPLAVLGGDPQDLKFDTRTPSRVRIGADSVVREHVTIHRSTKPDGVTEIGEHSFLMASSHIAHDCRVADHVVLANAVLLAGHVEVGRYAFLGGGAVIHQFCRIGESVMLSGGSRVSQDLAPYVLAAERNAIVGLNLIGLRRRGVARTAVAQLKEAFRRIYLQPGNIRERAGAALLEAQFGSAEARAFLTFFTTGKRGFARARRGGEVDPSE